MDQTPDLGGMAGSTKTRSSGGGMLAMPGQSYFKQEAAIPTWPQRPGEQPNYWRSPISRPNPNVKQWRRM